MILATAYRPNRTIAPAENAYGERTLTYVRGALGCAGVIMTPLAICLRHGEPKRICSTQKM